MDSKKVVPPGPKKENSKKQDIIKRNIAHVKFPRNKSKENSKPVPEKPVSRTKSQNNLHSNLNLKAKPKTVKAAQPLKAVKGTENKTKETKKPAGKKQVAEKVKAEEKVEDLEMKLDVQVVDKNEMVEMQDRGFGEKEEIVCDQVQDQLSLKGLDCDRGNDLKEEVGNKCEVMEKDMSEAVESRPDDADIGKVLSVRCTPVKENVERPIPSSYKRRRESRDEDYFEQKCLKST